MRKKFLRLWVVWVVMFVLGVGAGSVLLVQQRTSSRNGAETLLSLPAHSLVTMRLGEESLQVELANTPASAIQGLGNRDSLENDGMLFVFPDKQVQTFWMKDMRFAIDIIWIADGAIIGRVENVQPPWPGATSVFLERYVSPGPIDMVLETLPGKITPSHAP